MVESEHAVAVVAEYVGRGDQPQPDQDSGYLFPAPQRHIFKLGQAKYDHADHKRIQNHVAAVAINTLMACLAGKPWRHHDQHAKQHAKPVFPCSMSIGKPKIRHRKPPSAEAYVSGWRA